VGNAEQMTSTLTTCSVKGTLSSCRSKQWHNLCQQQ
jgi:hypothetical protein